MRRRGGGTSGAGRSRRRGAAGRTTFDRFIGVEEELFLVDAKTLRPTPAAAQLLQTVAAVGQRTAASPLDATLELEVKQEQIEVVLPPLRSHAELLSAIDLGRRAADDAARLVGARVVALATSVGGCEPHAVTSQRYLSMRERFGVTFDEQLTCGFHVHVSIQNRAEGVGILDRIRPWLPVVLALSANSPFWHGRDTEFASYRYQAWGRWPSAGPYDLFGSVAGYNAAIRGFMRTGVPLDAGMIYFDARLSTHAPTVETRIADVCLRPEDAACLAVLVRALVETAARSWRDGAAPNPVPVALLRAASWRASRFGLSGTLVHPITGALCPAGIAVRALLQHVHGSYIDAEEELGVRDGIARIIARGTGSDTQRAAASSGYTADELISVGRTADEQTADAVVGAALAATFLTADAVSERANGFQKTVSV